MTDAYRWIDPWEEISHAKHTSYADGYSDCAEGNEDDAAYAEQEIYALKLKLSAFRFGQTVLVVVAIVTAVLAAVVF